MRIHWQRHEMTSGGGVGSPRRGSDTRLRAMNGAVTDAGDRPEVTRRRALVIDDSDSARAALVAVLEAGGYEVTELPSAIGASRVAMQRQIDVAVVDMSMPGLSGDKLVKVFRDNPRLSRTVIVVVSGRSADELAEVARTTAVDGVLPKGEIRHELVPLLARLLAAR
jgi:CheY-like chemotaxis protein